MSSSSSPRPSDGGSARHLSRRRLLQLGLAGSAVVGAGAAGSWLLGDGLGARAAAVVDPHAPIVGATETSRYSTGRVVKRTLHAAPASIDLGGSTTRTSAFNDQVPGPELRLNVGDELRVRLVNGLPDPTTVHWHGSALRNDMDGVPDLTMSPVAPGGHFDYSFIAPDPGTYWYHPHVGVQLDTGLQGALIVEDPNEKAYYDDEVVLVLDDWTDGMGEAPADILARLGRDGMDMGGMDMDGMDMDMEGMMTTEAEPLGSDTGDVAYPAHVINGQLPQAPVTVDARPGRRIRFRLINAGSDTAYRFAIGGHRLTVTHADGFEVRPVEVDTLILGMGERYDVVVTTADGVFPIVAVPEGKDDPAGAAVLKTSSGSAPVSSARPRELSGRMLAYADLAPVDALALPSRTPDRELDVTLQMIDGGRRWYINGAGYGDNDPLDVRAGERVRLNLRNQTMMFHPMHLHGHTFALAGSAGSGVRKDTVNVLPMQSLPVDLEAVNPGQWLLHCHNTYHHELGMMAVLSYLA